MTHPVLTPIIIFDYPPLKDVPCAFQGDGTDTTWMGSSIITSGQSALAAKAKGPRDRSNPWGNFLHRLLPEGEIEVKYLHDIATKALPSDFSQDHHCVSAIHAATWFMGCKPPEDPTWPAIWDLAPHLLTPFPYSASEGMPLSFTQEGSIRQFPPCGTWPAGRHSRTVSSLVRDWLEHHVGP